MHVPQLACRIAQGNHQLFAGTIEAHAKRQNPLACQVGGLAWVGYVGAIALPIGLGLSGGALMFGSAAGSFCSRSLLGAGALCGLFGWAGAGGGLVWLGQGEPVILGHMQQGANAHGAGCLERLPGIATGPGVVIGGCAAPSVEHVKAGFIAELGMNSHPQARPFVTGQIRWDVAQGSSDGVGGVFGVVVVHD